MIWQLEHLPSLKELEIHGNPCTQKHSYKYDILWCSFLEVLDGQKVSPKDYDLAKAFQSNKEARPGSAPGYKKQQQKEEE